MLEKKSVRPHITAVVVAAGSSRRMGGKLNKQFILIEGIPVLARTLRQFDSADSVTDTVVVCRGEDILDVRSMIYDFNIKKVSVVVPGGETRGDSVRAGLRAAGNADIIAIHDGARPFVLPEKINAVIADAERSGAAALGVMPKDTVKITDDDGFILSTPPRSSLALIQTPQVFRADIIKRAYEFSEKTGFSATDDCALAEKLGIPIRITEGDYTNIKVTTPDDLPTANAICGFLNL